MLAKVATGYKYNRVVNTNSQWDVLFKQYQFNFQYFPNATLKSGERLEKKIAKSIQKSWDEHLETYNPGEHKMWDGIVHSGVNNRVRFTNMV